MSLTHSIARNTFTQIVGKIISTLVALAVVKLTTTYLGQAGYGQYTNVLSFLQFFGILADMGLYMVLIKEITRTDIDTDRVASNIFGLRLASAVIFLGLAPAVSLLFPYSSIERWGIALASLSFLCITLNQVLLGVYQKHLRVFWFTAAEVIGRVVLLGGTMFAVYLNKGLLWVLGAVVAGSVVNFVVVFWRSNRLARLRPHFDWPEWRRLLRMAAPLAFAVVLNVIYFKADVIILAWYYPDEVVGIYGAPYKVLEVLITFPAMFAGLLFPILSSAYQADDMPRFRALLQRSAEAMAAVALPLIAGTAVLGTPIMVAIADSRFADSGPLLKILIIATGIIFIGNLFGNLIITIGKQRQMVGVYLLVAASGLAGYLYFIPRFSYWGAAWMTVATEALVAGLVIALVLRTTATRLRIGGFLKIALASVVMASMLWPIREQALWITLPVAAAVYGIAVMGLRVVSWREVKDILYAKS